MITPNAITADDAGAARGMTLEVDALRRLIAEELVRTGVRIPPAQLTRISAAILSEAVRISLEWLEAESAF